MKQRFSITLAVVAVFAAVFGVAGCVGPRFKSPELPVPGTYMFDSVATPGDTIVTLDWWRNFGDTVLTALIERAVDSNRNLAIAASKLEEASLILRRTRAQQGPSLGVEATGNLQDNYKAPGTVQDYAVGLSVSWEIDLFGKLRRMSQAARADYLASEQNYRAALLSLTGQVAQAYFMLLHYDMAYHKSLVTYELRKKNQDIIDSMFRYGMSTLLDLDQARTLTSAAALMITSYERARTQTVLALNALLGDNPRPITVDGSRLLSIPVPSGVPAGLPTSLLDRRPDIMAAYYNVAAATARVGVAVARRYPSLTLTGEGGAMASTLKGLTAGNPLGWVASATFLEPIFNWGANKRNVEIAREQNKQALLAYEQVVIEAFGDVERALSAVAAYRQQSMHYAQLVANTKEAASLTYELYWQGMLPYTDVLTSQNLQFVAELQYADMLSDQLSAYVDLYLALGGGY